MTNFALPGLGPIASLDLSSAEAPGVSQATRIEKVSKAMESIFVGELTAELGNGIDGKPDPMSGGGQYQDFIKQAMSQAVSKGGGFGLAKMIQKSLTQMTHPDLAAHAATIAPTNSTLSTHASSH